MERTNYSSNSKWEPIVGYSRVTKVGSFVYVAGTTATNSEGSIVGINDPYQQAKQSIQNISTALQKAGSSLQHVVRTRIYVTNINDWELIGKAHGEYFGTIRPVTAMVEVSRLISPEILVEIEADAIITP